MPYKEYVPNSRIVDRAVVLWMTMLQNPKYDNLGENSPESPESIRTNRASSAIASMIPKNNTPDVLIRFGEELRKILMAPFTWQSDFGGKISSHTHLVSHLCVDYHPDPALRVAAERAGLKMEFPWKTSMYLYADHLSLSYGYGSSTVYHYPLSGDRWLTARLAGEDINSIVALIEAGVLTENLTAATPANA